MQEYKRGVEEGTREAMEDASRLSAEGGGQVKGAGEEALDGAMFLCVLGCRCGGDGEI